MKKIILLWCLAGLALSGCKDADPPQSEQLFQLGSLVPTYSSITVTVTPSDPAAKYYAGIAAQQEVASAANDQVFMEQIINGLPPAQLQEDLQSGMQTLEFKDLEAGTYYCVYAFGVSAEGKITSALFKAAVQTAPLPFAVTVSGETTTTTHIRVVPQDLAATYITMIATREKVDGYDSDEACYLDDMDYIRRMAALQGKTFEEQLGEYMMQGAYEDDIPELIPDTEYYVYVYGLTVAGERTTDIFRTPFETEPLQMVDCTFDVRHTMEYSEVTLDVHPSRSDVPYHAGIIDEPTYLEWGGDESKETFQKWFTNEIAYWRIHGKSLEEALALLTHTGDFSRVYDQLLPESAYHICVFAVDAAGYIVSPVEHVSVTTGKKRPSGNVITITVNPDEITSTSAVVRTTTTDDSEYILLTDEARLYTGMTDDEIIDYLLEDWGRDIYMIKTKGPQQRNVICSPERDYLVTAFGYKNGAATTRLYKYSFRTPAKEAKTTVPVRIDPTPRTAVGNGTKIPEIYRRSESTRVCIR